MDNSENDSVRLCIFIFSRLVVLNVYNEIVISHTVIRFS